MGESDFKIQILVQPPLLKIILSFLLVEKAYIMNNIYIYFDMFNKLEINFNLILHEDYLSPDV